MAPIRHIRLKTAQIISTNKDTAFEVRAFDSRPDAQEGEIAAWLYLRNNSFDGMTPSVRAWDALDFTLEIASKPWWNPGHCWFAFHRDTGVRVGMVTLAFRVETPAVHWLCVLPNWRRKGVAKLLMNALFQRCRDLNHAEVVVETHENWREANYLYEIMNDRG